MNFPKTPSFSLEYKRALVTGAGRGIGMGASIALAESGAKVTLVSRTEKELKDLALIEKDKYDNYVLTVDVNVKEDNVIYGSVNLQNILDKLKDDGFALEKRQVNLPRGPIRVLGDDHIVTISLHSDVQVTIPVKLNVVQSDDNNPNAPENASTEEPSVQTEE